jgi:pimeloyl-ACP methyl ester carboxylesterase
MGLGRRLPHAGEEIAGAKLVVIAAGGHLATPEQPAAVNRAMRAWLTD